MTTPPIDPVTPEPGLSASPTEPVPVFPSAFAPVEPDMGPAASPAAAPPAAAPRRGSSGSSGSSRILNLALGAAVLVAVAGVAFAVGRGTAPATSTAGSAMVLVPGQGGVVPGGNGGNLPGASLDPNGNGFPGAGGRNGVPGNRGGFGGLGGLAGGLVIEGTVDSVTADSVTIQTTAGTTITVGLDGSTTYHQEAAATASDVTAGATVKLQISGGFRPDRSGANGGPVTLGTAADVTVVP